MIPIYKLDRLPRTQKLRKIAKFFVKAEERLCMVSDKEAKIFTDAEVAFFSDAAKLLARDSLFSPEVQKLFADAEKIFIDEAGSLSAGNTELRRALNSVKHLLLSQTGKDQSDWDFTVGDGTLDSNKRRVFKGMRVYLEDIRSPFNVGAMFRSAESFGVEKIILSPFCADPLHRRAQRTAMGCVDIIPWERQELFAPTSAELQGKLPGYLPVFALETGGIPIDEFAFPIHGILVAGSEELGVSPRALEAADASLGRVSIPVYGAKASLNVSTAFGIALQKWAQTLAPRYEDNKVRGFL